MQITKMPIEKLKPAAYNPRIDLPKTDPRYRKLRRSLRDFGLVEPLVWNQRTGHVIGGHQRLKILRELGVREVPVSIVDLPLEREKALNVVLNNRELQADWDVVKLGSVLEELAATPLIELTATGFDVEHLELIRQRLQPPPEPPRRELAGVEIVLNLTPSQFEAIRPRLDQLLAEHELEYHIRIR